MSCGDFMAQFGGSCRTKHLLLLPTRRRELARFVWGLLRGRTVTVNRRPFALPTVSGLPRELIRLDPWEAEYLFLVAARATRGIVEIGRLRGGSTFLLACANPRVPIWSIDVNPEHDDSLRRLFAEHDVGGNVELLVGDSHRGSFPELSEYDVLFIDGDHGYAACSADLANHFPGLAPGGHVVLHDSYEGNPVQHATVDFSERHEVETIRSPYIIGSHWHTSYGSMAHLRKAGTSEPRSAGPVQLGT
jgi:predicted O-methyltransferase YrrM